MILYDTAAGITQAVYDLTTGWKTGISLTGGR